MSLKTSQISESHVRSTLSANEFKLNMFVLNSRDLSATEYTEITALKFLPCVLNEGCSNIMPIASYIPALVHFWQFRFIWLTMSQETENRGPCLEVFACHVFHHVQ